jgi:hypothetical protein
MGKRTITKWWVVGAGLLALAAVLIIANSVALLAHNDSLAAAARNGIAPDDFARTMLVLILIGAVVAAIGLVIELVAWVGAVGNARRLADRRWFKALLGTGIAGTIALPLFGFGAMVAGGGMLVYLVGAPDTTSQASGMSAPPRVWSKAAIVRWATWMLVLLLGGALIALVVANLGNSGGVLHGHVWTSLVLLTVCAVIVVCSVIAEAAAWLAALLNVHLLVDRTWFNVLLWTGIAAILTMPLLGLGALIAMGVGIAYLAAAPDGLAPGACQPERRAAPKSPAPTNR